MGILDSPSFMKSDEQSAHLIDESSVKANFLAGNSLMLYFHLKSKPTMPLVVDVYILYSKFTDTVSKV